MMSMVGDCLKGSSDKTGAIFIVNPQPVYDRRRLDSHPGRYNKQSNERVLSVRQLSPCPHKLGKGIPLSGTSVHRQLAGVFSLSWACFEEVIMYRASA